MATKLETRGWQRPACPAVQLPSLTVPGGEVVLLISQAGAVGSSVFTDTAKSHPITSTGAVWTDAQKLFCKNTIWMDGNSYLKVANVLDMALATGQPFCFEFWYKPHPVYNGVLARNLFGFPPSANVSDLNNATGLGGYAYVSYLNSEVTYLGIASSSIISVISSPFTNDLSTDWNHVVFSRDAANNIRFFVNGKLTRTGVNGGAVTAASGIFYVGAGGGTGGAVGTQGNGYFAEIRFTKGVPVYTENFTPPCVFVH